jgi:hypothetical protein
MVDRQHLIEHLGAQQRLPAIWAVHARRAAAALLLPALRFTAEIAEQTLVAHASGFSDDGVKGRRRGDSFSLSQASGGGYVRSLCASVLRVSEVEGSVLAKPVFPVY